MSLYPSSTPGLNWAATFLRAQGAQLAPGQSVQHSENGLRIIFQLYPIPCVEFKWSSSNKAIEGGVGAGSASTSQFQSASSLEDCPESDPSDSVSAVDSLFSQDSSASSPESQAAPPASDTSDFASTLVALFSEDSNASSPKAEVRDQADQRRVQANMLRTRGDHTKRDKGSKKEKRKALKAVGAIKAALDHAVADRLAPFPGLVVKLRYHEAKAFAELTAKDDDGGSLILWTDGSLLSGLNKGQAGAAVAYKEMSAKLESGQRPWTSRSWSVSRHRRHIETVEVFAIVGALEIAIDSLRTQQTPVINTVSIFSDSLAAIDLCHRTPGGLPLPIVSVARQKAQDLVSGMGVRLHLIGVPGHSDVEGNIRADNLAKAAACLGHGSYEGIVPMPQDCNEVKTLRLCDAPPRLPGCPKSHRRWEPSVKLTLPQGLAIPQSASRTKPVSLSEMLEHIEGQKKLLAQETSRRSTKAEHEYASAARWRRREPVSQETLKKPWRPLPDSSNSPADQAKQRSSAFDQEVSINWKPNWTNEGSFAEETLKLLKIGPRLEPPSRVVEWELPEISGIGADVFGPELLEAFGLLEVSSTDILSSTSPPVIILSVNTNVSGFQLDMASASPSSSLSSSESFVTAHDSIVDKSTAASSPVQGNPCPYRDARPLPRELKAHCHIFLEEQLYASAINLLNSIASSGASKRTIKKKPVPVPPPSHIALLNTLVIHPIHTTRVEKKDHLDVSSQALDYLRNILAVVGPINAGFRTAFQFRSVPRCGRRWEQPAVENDSDTSDGELSGDEERLRGRIANDGSIWNRGQDFWSTIGWAFNCSALYPNRWRYWKVWLEFMLDVLEADWIERERRDKEAQQANGHDGEAPQTSREESIIAMYMDQQTGRQNGVKGIIKALFADGCEISSSAYHEVFEKERRGPRKQSKKRKREQVLDLENDKFGDYFDDESMSSGVSEPPTPQKPKDTRKLGTEGIHTPGMVESVGMRLRLFKLLSAVTYALRKRSELHRLYEEYTAMLKLLPLPTFSLFVTQRPNILLPETHITITKELFDLLLPGSYKPPSKVDPEGDADGSLTLPMLECCYVLHPANTVALEDNAKLSLVVENAIQLLWACDMMIYTQDFEAAVERGIEAREAKARKRRTGKMKGDAGDALAQDVLANSGERIRILVEALKSTAEEAEP
ncbi:hypothetical protein ACJZ2D_003935 [Fusarium nematophilum]